jgi:hypothetical protein
VIFGGPEAPCQNKGVLAEIQGKTGRPCPRVELDPANVVPSDVIKFVLDERLSSFAEGHFQDYTSDWSPLDRIEMRNRLAAAIHSPEVERILHPKRPVVKK